MLAHVGCYRPDPAEPTFEATLACSHALPWLAMAYHGDANSGAPVLPSAACPDYAYFTLGALNTLPEDGGSCSGLQLDCSVLLLARARKPELSWPQSAVPWHLLRLLRYSGRPVAVSKSPLTLPRRGAIDLLTAVASWRRVTADGQGELAMNSALSLVSTWRNCPRRGPPPYNVGSLPGEAPVRRSMAAARASPHPGCEFLGGEL